jgi:hypothetical protein
VDEFRFQLARDVKSFFSLLAQGKCIRQLALEQKLGNSRFRVQMYAKKNRETIESNFKREGSKKMCNRAIKRCFASVRVKENFVLRGTTTITT